MKTNSRAWVGKIVFGSLGIALVALPACYGDMDSMANHSAVFGEHTNAYRAELSSHQAAIEAASDLPQIAALEAEHGVRAQPHMSGMRHEIGDMMGCMGPAGEQPQGRNVLTDLDGLQGQHDSHRAAMAGATDMAAARGEETRHQNQMAQMMANMATHFGAMMDGTDQFACPHHGR
jgi:hypothetical protein